MRSPLVAAVTLALVAVACGAPAPSDEVTSRVTSDLTVGGCSCPTSGSCSALTYSGVPSDDTYYVTTFGGGSDTQPMACGGTADGTWAYVADEARFGCGAKLQITANGKGCIAQVSDCGPNRCVEQAAANDGCKGSFPIIDASPFITEYLFNSSGEGWSDHTKVTAVLVPSSTPIGCPGGPVAKEGGASEGGSSPADAGGAHDAGGSHASDGSAVDAAEGDAAAQGEGGAEENAPAAADGGGGAGSAAWGNPSQGGGCSLGQAETSPGVAWGLTVAALFLLERRRRR